MKWEKDTHRGRRPRPLGITPITITGGGRAEERAWGSHRADSTEPRGAGAVHRLRRREEQVRCLQPCTPLLPHVPSPLPSTLTCNSSRWICSDNSWISGSRDRDGLGTGAVNTSSFSGALWGGEG